MPPTQTNPSAELSDAEAQALLAGQAVRGPRSFRGRDLADYTSGLRDLVLKVVRFDDTAVFHDATLLYILAEAHATAPEEKVARRRTLLLAADDVAGFRARLSVEWVDTLSADEIAEARRIASAILDPVDLAQVAIVTPLGAKKAKKKA